MKFKDIPEWAQDIVRDHIRKCQSEDGRSDEWYSEVLKDYEEYYEFTVDDEYHVVTW